MSLYTTPTIKVTPAGGAANTITNVQYIQISAGRTVMMNPWNPRTTTFEFIPAAGSYSPKVSDLVEIQDASGFYFFYGYVIESQRTYEIPYNSVTGAAPMDRVTVTAQGPMGRMGQTSATWSTSGYGAVYAYYVANTLIKNASGVNIAYDAPTTYPYNPVINPSSDVVTDTGYMLDSINKLARTCNWCVFDGIASAGAPSSVAVMSPQTDQNYFTFTDTGSGGFSYNKIEFASNSQNQINQVIVNQYLGTAQQATAAGATYLNTWTNDTYFANDNADAASVANYLLATNAITNSTPTQITASNIQANNSILLDTLYQGRTGNKTALGRLIAITLRGSTYQAIVQGFSALFTPVQVTVDFQLMPTLGAGFILDSPTNGVLDVNVLGL